MRNKQRIFKDERCQTVREKKNKQTVNRSMDEKRKNVIKHDFLLDVHIMKEIFYTHTHKKKKEEKKRERQF